jgi:hypothetical protein
MPLAKLTAALSLVLLSSSGGWYLYSWSGGPSIELTKREIKRQIERCQHELPYEIDDHFTLTKITLDYSGTLSWWYTVSDEKAAEFRKVGSVKLKEHAKKTIKNVDLEASGAPPRVRELLFQDNIAIQYILEDKYGTHLASLMISQEALEGKERIGRLQQNPFAVSNVSKRVGK